MPRLRTLLILGRVSNLPTVWSNCLAGWWLGGGGNFKKLPWLFAGATLLYMGGMYLNDAFDAEYDRQRRKTRPIPSGAISLSAVWRFGLLWLVLGAGCLFGCGIETGVLGLALLFCILIYDVFHKLVAISPVLMGICRFFVYIVAASVGIHEVAGGAIWCGLALGAYVAGASFLARQETSRRPIQYWPLILLAVPIALALLMDVNGYRKPAFLVSIALALWILRCVQLTLWTTVPKVGRAVAGLLAGIVLVDLLAAADVLLQTDSQRALCVAFLLLFPAALIGQRFFPAT